MNEKQKKVTLKGFLGITALLAGVMMSAVSSQATVYVPKDGNGIRFTNVDFIGATVYRVESSTPTHTPILLVSGSGFVYSVTTSSGVATDYCVGMDSASINGITMETQGKAITPAVWSANSATGCTSNGSCGMWTPAAPVRFENGLVGIKVGTNADCLFVVRKDTGSNP